MKKLWILSLLFLAGCNEGPKVGECYIGKDQYNNKVVIEITEVGNYSFLVKDLETGKIGILHIQNYDPKLKIDCNLMKKFLKQGEIK